ncbi:MAG: hypothetical protein HY645_15490 [Acidobacteria bacterium]|nr:hypothetical protein [Acidobacteriota bacterium]
MIRNLVRSLAIVGMLSLSLMAQEDAAPQPASDQPSFKREVSQTSLFPGDHFRYVIELYVPAGIRVALEDFDQKSVNFDPFVLKALETSQQELNGTSAYRFSYHIVNYEIGDQILEIPGLIFRYEKQGAAGANGPTTLEMQIPPMMMGVRSTLNMPVEHLQIEDTLPYSIPRKSAWLPLTVGLAGLLLSSMPLFALVRTRMPDWQARRKQLSRRKFMQKCLTSLERLEKSAATNNGHVKEHYKSLEALTQEYIQYFWNVPAAGLTDEELDRKLNLPEITQKQREVLINVVRNGQSCRYAPAANGTDWHVHLHRDVSEMKRICA